VFNQIIHNESISGRSTHIIEVFNNLQTMGARVTLGLVTKDSDEVKEVIVKAVMALYCLEQLQFMASFSCTFALAEQDLFLGAAKLVQKIMLDEKNHAAFGKETLLIISKDELLSPTYNKLMVEWFPNFLAKSLEQEHGWGKYVFSEGRSILGLTTPLLNDWSTYNATIIADTVGIKFEGMLHENPLPWMDYWTEIDKTQVANQETDNTNYLLNSVVDDLGDDELDF
jgi:ribonucleoside-diphosphate reductase beta chain